MSWDWDNIPRSNVVSSDTLFESYACLPPGHLVAFNGFRDVDPLEGSMIFDYNPNVSNLHRSWVVMDGRGNVAVSVFVPSAAESPDCYGIGGAVEALMPRNQFQGGIKVCTYTPRGEEPWEYADTESDGFFRNLQVM
jgi:hypothetical protein